MSFNWEKAGGFGMAAEAIVEAGQTTEMRYMSDKHDIANYYKQEYGKSWQKHLGNDLATVNGGKTTADSYKRSFRPDRINRTPTPEFAAKLEKLGKTLPGEEVTVQKPVAGKRARVKTKIRMRISKDKKDRLKDINVTISASQAKRMRNGDLDGVIEAYGGINPDEIVSAEIDSFEVEYL